MSLGEQQTKKLHDIQSPNWVGTEQQFQMLWWFVSSIVVLNGLDAMLTLNWVERGQANEANPLMEIIISNPLLFVCVKLALVSFGCYLLWERHRRPVAVVGIFTAFVAYYAVFLHHLRAIDLVSTLPLL